MTFKNWNIENLTGYKPITTYYMDFSIADKFGGRAILDTYKKAVKYVKSAKDVALLTELVMVLNWKIFEHYHSNNKTYAKLYNNLYNELDGYACDTLKGDDLNYYYRTTD
ncbi:MAG: hypothetical protein J6I69_02315 [Bacilli bacterium]|nr:hypothetical protein [Bacilli bacterium]